MKILRAVNANHQRTFPDDSVVPTVDGGDVGYDSVVSTVDGGDVGL